MAKRKPSGTAAPRKTVRRRKGAATWASWFTAAARNWVPGLGVLLAVVSLVVGYVRLQHAPAPEPEAQRRYPIVSLNDTPAEAIAKSHARYLLNWADSLDDFAAKADTFTESGDAAKWFADRTTKARKEAYADPGGFDQYVFGHAGGTPDGQDRYDAATLKVGAKEMAAECRADAAKLLGR